MAELQALAHAVRSGATSALHVADQALERAAERRALNAFDQLDDALVRAQAAAIDERVSRGEDPGPLAGVPVALKANMVTPDLPTTCSSRILQGYEGFYDATVAARLRAAGAILFGKTAMDEFAMGSSGEHASGGPALHPTDPTRVPGGSSSGSASAVGAGIVPAALGSDTGGSIRLPAAFCGVVGFKPTYGRVSRRGLVAFASSFDQIGPLTRSLEDAALIYEVIAGRDPLDATTVSLPVTSALQALDGASPRGLRVGVDASLLGEGLQPEIRTSLERAAHQLGTSGAEIVPISLKMARYAVATYYVLTSAEASSNLSRFDGVHFGVRAAGAEGLEQVYTRSRTLGFGPEVRRRILLGTFVLSAGSYDAYYAHAQKVRTLFCREFEQVFQACDVVLLPTTPTTAFRLGNQVRDPLAMYLQDAYTIPASLAGLPALSMPLGVDEAGLPIGAQLLAAPFAETTLFRAAGALRSALAGAGGLP